MTNTNPTNDAPQVTNPRPDCYALNAQEQEILQVAANSSLFNKSASASQKELVSTAAQISQQIDKNLTNLFRKIRCLRDLRTSPGLLLVKDLPQVSDPRRLTCILGSALGPVTKFEGEGDYIITVKEQATTSKDHAAKAGDRPAFDNSREFFLHTDLSYSVYPPEFMLLHSIVNSPDEGGYSVFCDVENVIPHLSPQALEELQKPQFLFPAAKHYKGISVVQFPILRRDKETGAWRIRFRRDNIRTLTRTGIEALVDLVKIFEKVSYETALLPRSLVLVDNEAFLHGRTAFLGSRPSSEPREILRIYSSRNN